MCRSNKLGEFFKLHTGWQAAAYHQQRAGLNFQHLILKLVELVIGKCCPRHNKSILLAAGFYVDVKILPGPVFGLYGGDRDIFIGKQ
ncbi:hypothetical protein D3C81_2006280 [compost metagenome]